jgi:hypothetical protein
MDKVNVLYTGIGARKSGNHTKKQYLQVMDKNFKKDCSVYIKSLKCKSCKKLKKIWKTHLKNKTNKMRTKTEKKFGKEMDLCIKCKNNKTKKCNYEEYVLFSGAEPDNV